MLPKKVKIVEVSPRDGLQNENKIVPTAVKVEFINRLTATGVKHIEVTSFVSPNLVPQMADNVEVMSRIIRQPDVTYSALVPNLKGFDTAVTTKISEIAVFTSASETFTHKNINTSIQGSLQQFTAVIDAAKTHHIPVRGYVSCVLGCPFEGEIKPEKVAKIATSLFNLGCHEISLGDTIGVGTAGKAKLLINTVAKTIPKKHIAVHFHDTYGQALANIYAVLECGISIIDSSVAGLGGCPFAPGASGNVATEDVLYLLNGLNIETGINLKTMVEAGKYISQFLGQPSRSKVSLAIL